MEREPLTPAFVQEYLRRMVDIDISLEEAAAIIPTIASIIGCIRGTGTPGFTIVSCQ